MINDEVVPYKESGSAAHDAALARRLAEGEPEAARELCDRFGPKLFAYAAARFPGEEEAAKDLMIQSLAAATRHIQSFNPHRSSLTTWLYGITRQRIWYELRQRRRRKSVPASALSSLNLLAETSDERDLASEVVAGLHPRRQLARLAETLSHLEFEVLVLNGLDDLSAGQIGQIVGRSERAVHSLLHRARTKARERLAKDESRDI